MIIPYRGDSYEFACRAFTISQLWGRIRNCSSAPKPKQKG